MDSAGNVISQFVGSFMIKNGNTYQLVTDHLGSVRLVVDVNTGDVVQKIDYDEFGNVISDSNPDFQPFAYAGGLYDTLKGFLSGIITQNEDSLTYLYDGDLPKKINWTGTVRGNIAFTYNNDHQIITEKINNADSINLKYDRDGLLTTAGAMKFAYSSVNKLLLNDTLCNVVTEYAYNLVGEPTSQRTKYGSNILFQADYTRDSLGRVYEKRENYDGVQTKFTYKYNNVGRLCEVKRNDTLTTTYSYDSNGNRLELTTPTSIAHGIYDNQDRLITYDSVSYIYNAGGDLKMKIKGSDTTYYVYDALGNLLSITMPSGIHIEYIIDGGGRRIARKVNGVIVQRWLYRNGLQIAAELDSINRIIKRFVFTGKINVPDCMIKDGIMYRIVTDNLGSVRQVINSTTGVVEQRIDYDEYGRVIFDNNPGFVPFGFAGGLYDTETKLLRFGARDYDANIGRWTVKDPIGFGGGVSNLFEYCVNDPINISDIEGLQPKYRLVIKRLKPSPVGIAKGMAVSYYLEAIEAPWWARVFFEYPLRAADLIPALILNTEIAQAPGSQPVQIDEVEYEDEGDLCPSDATRIPTRMPKEVRIKGFKNGNPIFELIW